jgi:hypothetical protein
MSTFADEMRTEWGRDGLQRARPESSKQFLLEVGLPKKELLCITFEMLEDPLPTMEEVARAKGQSCPAEACFFLRLGCGGHAPDFALTNDSQGKVMEVDFDPPRLRFVNSRVQHLGAFLLAYARSRVREEMSREDNLAYVASMRAELEKIDPEALSNSDNWWSLVLEQMEDSGL